MAKLSKKEIKEILLDLNNRMLEDLKEEQESAEMDSEGSGDVEDAMYYNGRSDGYGIVINGLEKFVLKNLKTKDGIEHRGDYLIGISQALVEISLIIGSSITNGDRAINSNENEK